MKADNPKFERSFELTVDCDFDETTAAWQWDTMKGVQLVGDVPNAWLARLPWSSFASNENLRTLDVSLTFPTDVDADKGAVQLYVPVPRALHNANANSALVVYSYS